MFIEEVDTLAFVEFRLTSTFVAGKLSFSIFRNCKFFSLEMLLQVALLPIFIWQNQWSKINV